MNDVFRSRCEMRRLRSERAYCIVGCRIRERTLLSEYVGKSQKSHAGPELLKRFSTGHAKR